MDLISTRVCMTKDIGVNNYLFGGVMMSLIDESAAVYACMYCDTPKMITLKVSEMLFLQPVKVGDIIKVYGKVGKLGNTSITLNIDVKHHNPYNSDENSVTSTQIVFVKIDENGEPSEIGQKIQDKFKKRNTLKGE